jgi:hypothetical protein
MPFGRFSASLCHRNQLAAVAEFWFSADWPPYSLNLNSLVFSIGSVLQPGYVWLIWRAYVHPSPWNYTG